MIDTRPVFPKISNYPMWPEYNNPIAQRISQSALNLPSGHNLTEEQIEYIVENGLDAFISKQNGIKSKYPKE